MVLNKTKAKVLVVDDEPSILTSISDLLAGDFDVRTTTSPQHGLDNLAAEEIAVLISDQRMPDMNGDRFLCMARERSSATRVLLTGFTDIEALVRAVNDGKIYAYVHKPWEPLALRATIRNAASEYRLLDVLRSERNLLKTLVDNIPNCVYVQDSSQRYTLVNRAFAKLAGMADPGQAVGKTEVECLPGVFGQIASADGRQILQTGGPIISKCDEWQEDGTVRWFSTTRIPIRNPIDGHIESLVGVSIDVTEQKQTEKYLWEARRTAEKTVRAKGEFLARTSHEIRTPLNCILGMAQLIAGTHLSEQQGTYVGILRSNGEMLLRLLNDMIDLSRLDLNEWQLVPAEFEPREMVKTVVDSFAKDAVTKGIHLRLELGNDIPASAIGDAGRLKQVLNNLLNNALKFTSQGEICVKMMGTPAMDGKLWLEFAVEDSGIGIAQDKLNDIFEPFNQAEEFITGQYGGSGLGLTICRQLVQRMGGTIGVRSSPGAGSIFHFTTRLQAAGIRPPALPAIKQGKLAASPLAGLSVLLAEDNDDNAFLVQEYLGASVKIDVAINGREAVDKFVAGRFDIVLMDLRMPELDGLQATRLIREWERSERRTPTPILAYTAHEDSEEVSLEAGCTGHLVKPLSGADLVTALAKHTAPVN